ARRARGRVGRRAAHADRRRLRARADAVQPSFTVESRVVPDHELVFAVHLSERGGFDEMLGALARSVLRHAGYPEADIAGLGDEMLAGVAKAGTAGAEY